MLQTYIFKTHERVIHGCRWKEGKSQCEDVSPWMTSVAFSSAFLGEIPAPLATAPLVVTSAHSNHGQNGDNKRAFSRGKLMRGQKSILRKTEDWTLYWFFFSTLLSRAKISLGHADVHKSNKPSGSHNVAFVPLQETFIHWKVSLHKAVNR